MTNEHLMIYGEIQMQWYESLMLCYDTCIQMTYHALVYVVKDTSILEILSDIL